MSVTWRRQCKCTVVTVADDTHLEEGLQAPAKGYHAKRPTQFGGTGQQDIQFSKEKHQGLLWGRKHWVLPDGEQLSGKR